MGAFAKSGSRPIQGVIKVAEPPPRPGLWMMDSVPDAHFMQFGYTNPNDTEGIMDLICGGRADRSVRHRARQRHRQPDCAADQDHRQQPDVSSG